MSEITARPLHSRRSGRGRFRRLMLTTLAASGLLVGFAGAMWAAGRFDPRALPLLWSEPLQLAKNLARTDPVVRQHLGEIRRFAFLPRGEVHVDGVRGWSQFELEVHGTRGDGRLEMRLVRQGGQWFWEWANLRLEDGTLLVLGVP